MLKKFWFVVVASLIGLQGCSSGGSPSAPSSEPPKPGSSSSSSSSSGSVASSSSSSSSSSGRVASSSSSSSSSGGGSSSSSSSSSGGSADLAAAKSLVSSVRSALYFNFEDTIDSLGRLFVGDTRTAFYAFRDKVYKAQLVNGAHPEYLLEALGKVGNVIAEALSANIQGTATEAKMITLDNVTVAFTPVPAGLGWTHTYKILQVVDVCKGTAGEDTRACSVDVDLTVVANFGRKPTGSTGPGSQNVNASSVKINLNGSLKNAYLSAAFIPAMNSNHVSSDLASFQSDETQKPTWDSSLVVLIESGPLALNLPLRLSRLPDNDIVADLNVKANAASLLLRVSNNSGSELTGSTEVNTNELRIGFFRFDDVKIEAGADVSSDGERFVFKANIDKPNAVVSMDTDTAKYTLVSKTVESCPVDARCAVDSDIEILGETTTDFLPLAASVDFNAVLKGVPASDMALDLSRKSNKLIELTQLKVTSKDNVLNITGVMDWYGVIESLIASNSSGTSFTVQSTSAGVRSGNIKAMNGSILATVVNQVTGFDVKYTDGTSSTFK
jgi:hypothetical protein